ncbi:MAG: cysteine hydrolase [Candidatus Moranbacteria bacterium]|nr:cysteine hydrolase [Candidatus Moranbacteria bacterium]
MKPKKGLAFVLMDMQMRNGSATDKREIIPHQVAVLRTCRHLHIPVIIVEFVGRGTTNRKLIDAVSGYENVHLIEKKDWNAFNGTSLDETFDTLGIGSFLLGGVEAGVCLYETAIDAIARGYQVTACGALTAGYGKRYSGPNRSDLWRSIGASYVEHVGAAHRFLQENPHEDP